MRAFLSTIMTERKIIFHRYYCLWFILRLRHFPSPLYCLASLVWVRTDDDTFLPKLYSSTRLRKSVYHTRNISANPLQQCPVRGHKQNNVHKVLCERRPFLLRRIRKCPSR